MLRTISRICLLAACLSGLLIHAAVIPTLFSTGVDASGNALSPGSVDPHYTISGPTGGPSPFVTLDPSGLGWIGNIGPAQWVDPDGNGGGPGTFTYTTTFDLTGFDLTTASISGNLAADDQADVFLNGSLVGSAPIGAWAFYTPIIVNSGFIAGINTLTFVAPNTGGPGGLQFSVSGTADPLPEPGSILLFVSGIAACIARRVRR